MHISNSFVDNLQVTWHQEWLQDLLLVWGLARGGHETHANRLLQSLNTRQVSLVCSVMEIRHLSKIPNV